MAYYSACTALAGDPCMGLYARASQERKNESCLFVVNYERDINIDYDTYEFSIVRMARYILRIPKSYVSLSFHSHWHGYLRSLF